MAIAFTYLAETFDTVARSVYTAAPTFTPGANSLLIALVEGSLASSPTDPTGVTGHGATYAQVAVTGTLGTQQIMSVWVADAGASPTSAAAAATFASTRTGGVVMEWEVSGVDLTGGAAAAIVQIVTQTGTATSVTATNLLAAAGNAANRAVAFWLHQANETTTEGGGNWAEPVTGGDGTFATPSTSAETQFTASTFDRSPAASWTTSSLYRVIALEIKATVAGGGGFFSRYYYDMAH